MSPTPLTNGAQCVFTDGPLRGLYPTSRYRGTLSLMVYPGNFHRLVVIGDLYNAETFNFTLSIAPLTGAPPIPAVTQELVDDIGTIVATWWPKAVGSGGVGIAQTARLQSVKLNRIGPDGTYVDPLTMESVVGPIQGGVGVLLPAQNALAVSTRSVVPRGRGSANRFYLPPVGALSPVGSDGRITVANAQGIANGAKALIELINGAYAGFGGGFDVLHRVAVTSDAGSGVFRDVVEVRVGRVGDTIRSRRSSLLEDYQVAAISA